MSITVKNLYKAFDSKTIFENFSFNFEDNKIYLIEGDSGIGKTTLLRILSGLDTSYRGEVLGGGLENCAFMFQEYRLFPTISALENVLLSRQKDKRNIDEAKALLFRLGFTDEEIYLLPDMLSGGMKGRVSFARALYSQRPILLLDEPTKELDSSNADTMLQIIKEESENKTIILVSHTKIDHILDMVVKIKL